MCTDLISLELEIIPGFDRGKEFSSIVESLRSQHIVVRICECTAKAMSHVEIIPEKCAPKNNVWK